MMDFFDEYFLSYFFDDDSNTSNANEDDTPF